MRRVNFKKIIACSLLVASFGIDVNASETKKKEINVTKVDKPTHANKKNEKVKVIIVGTILTAAIIATASIYAYNIRNSKIPASPTDLPNEPSGTPSAPSTPIDDPHTPDPVVDPVVDPAIPDVLPNDEISKIPGIVKTKIQDVYIWKGDITKLKVDAIVNAANNALGDGGGVCGAIFEASGKKQLTAACKPLGGCKTGEAKVTDGFALPCKYIIHTVGPCVAENTKPENLTQKEKDLLASCYESCLKLADEKKLNSIAFCCISTSLFHFPNEEAAKIAIETVKKYKEKTKSKIKVIFDVFLDKDKKVYKEKIC